MKTIVSKSENTGKSSRSFFTDRTASGFFTKQAKLNVGQPNDKYEQEADRVADQVVSSKSESSPFFAPSQSSAVQTKLADSITPLVQKQDEEEEEEAQTKFDTHRIQRDKEEEEPQAKLEVQRQAEEEEAQTKSEIQRQPEEEEEALQAKPENNSIQRQNSTETLLSGSRGNGSPLNSSVQAEMENGFGADFSGVKIHTDSRAVQMNQDLGARAFTSGNDIYFNSGNYQPQSREGKKLLAHELTHTIQQGASRGQTQNISKSAKNVQMTAQYDVTNWSPVKLGPPVPRNGADPRTIAIPPTGQIRVNADVTVNGQPGDQCNLHEIGTTQTAWGNWIIADYRGATPADGSMTVSHRAPMPMRDPAPGGSVWYDPNNVRMPSGCGSSVRVSHFDSPWHGIPKARNNPVVAGNPLNYLHRYRRALFLVTYLTANDNNGNFLRRPLRFVYWNSIQDFRFTPQTATPAAAFGMWPFTGQITVNIGSKGRGATTDAPYYRTGGVLYNNHFANFGNWRVVSRRRY
ncbi:DUF4157 domain-containing protein [Draconibacterium sp. IB214405]|uniref:eCIS core domain-containing protein n=1 Tax=Draconibacterium sp. IB214405 TaxID=3097352 RepID=UPI002A101CA6|nr:DUF4157 domain-containing protein [Draconibacterium sp. IB214405]MDX8339928.1 DUF4157 domain-containing protein [Draconibacterium sp. IB214405]